MVLENENKYTNYGIYANGVLTETIDEISLLRFYNKNNKNNTIKIVNVSKKKHKQTHFK